MDALCRMPGKRVRLHGLGRVWAWIGLIGGAVGLLGVTVLTVFGNRAAAAGNFASPQLLVSLCAIIGYAMLLRNRRAGLYVVGIGALLLLGGQFTDAVGQLVHGYGVAVSRMISALVGALNPLFAVLAVRAGRAEE